MEEKIRFRNHISIIIERTGAGFWVLIGILFWQLIDDPETIHEISQTEDGLFWLFIAIGVFLAVIFVILFIQYLIWSKTYISVDGTSIVFEKNTLKYQKKTIGIKNISNINTEQNLFEMLLGTCKVKMDTNSMSTADATDLTIVLKKKDAQQFQSYILSLMKEKKDVSFWNDKDDSLQSVNQKGVAWKEMVLHGLLSIRLVTVIIAFASVLGLASVIMDTVSQGGLDLQGSLSSLLVLFFIAVSSLWNILKGFLRYYGFRVERRVNRLYIEYGLMKKVKYTIPVDKINAIRLVQSPQARIMNYYTVELINVGMGDDQEEEKSFFLMYDREERIGEKLKHFLPEFSGCTERMMERQPLSVWTVWSIPLLLTLIVILVGAGTIMDYYPELRMVIGAVSTGLIFLVLLSLFLKYITEGSTLKEDLLGICKGAFGRKLTFVKYDKIQYIRTKQNFIAKHFHIIQTTISLLAASSNRIHEIPYQDEEIIEILKKKILEQ